MRRVTFSPADGDEDLHSDSSKSEADSIEGRVFMSSTSPAASSGMGILHAGNSKYAATSALRSRSRFPGASSGAVAHALRVLGDRLGSLSRSYGVKWVIAFIVLLLIVVYVVALRVYDVVESPAMALNRSGLVDSNGFRWFVGSFIGVSKLLPLKTPEPIAAAIGLGLTGMCESSARLGNVDQDGGWNVCLDPPLSRRGEARLSWPPQGCVVYSFGSNNDFSFDVAAASLGCEVHVFDPSMPWFAGSAKERYLRTTYGIHFHSAGLGPSTYAESQKWPVKSVREWMRELGHARLEILKMDVEGTEWQAVPFLFSDEEFARYGALDIHQILLEVHLNKVESDSIALALFRQFEKHGFQLWCRDDNWRHSNIMRFADRHYVRAALELSYRRAV